MKRKYFIPSTIFVLGLLIYWTSAFPTITWWDASEYSVAASCLGITGAPGSIIMTLLGWIVTRFSSHPALLLNLLAGFLGSLVVVFAFFLFRKIIRVVTDNENYTFTLAESIVLIIASVIIICSATLWEYSVMFTPYVLTALFTLFIIYAVFKWWENADREDSWKYIFIITLLLGLDFSVHRTNSVLIPGIIILMLIRDYRFVFHSKSYIAAFAGMLLGLTFQLLYIPVSLRDPLFNVGETNSFHQLWDFISLKQYGGSFLLDIFVRKGPFWKYQVPYYLSGFAQNFFYHDKTTHFLGFLPAILGFLGIIYLFMGNRKIALSLTLFFIITIFTSIIYFNLPENYFRTIYRHYLPTYIIFCVFIFFGTIYLIQVVSKFKKNSLLIFSFLILIAIAFTQFSDNFKIKNGSKNTIAYDHSKNILLSVEKNGILFGNWDNNYFPELYVQIGEGYRTDITQCNLSFSNFDWYLLQRKRHDKNFPFKGEDMDIKKMFYQNWKTKTCTIFLDSNTRKNYSVHMDSLQFSIPVLRENNYILLQDLAVFDIIKNNQWKRPIYFVKQGFGPELYNWLEPYLSDEGLVYRFVPDSSRNINTEAIERNLENFTLAGFNNPSVFLDRVSTDVGNLYYGIFINVINAKLKNDDKDSAAKYFNRMKQLLPVARLNPDKTVLMKIDEIEQVLKVN